ncbi:MAG TPA: ion transporter [Caulobacteraceae bacterium]|jgi:voltage-gated potassium channel
MGGHGGEGGQRAGTGGLRHALYCQLEPAARTRKGLSPLNQALTVLILIAVASAVLETEPAVLNGREGLFHALEWGFAGLFALEYLARVWVAVENPRCGSGLSGRLRYVLTFAALTDLFVVLVSFLGAFGAPAFILRLVRLARILRVAKLGRTSAAWRLIGEAVGSRRYELALTFGAAAGVLLVTATMLYLVEGAAQPKAFGSVPRAMWWSVVTLTTIGYGDVYPVTVAGKLFAGLTAVLSIGIIAAPTGILAAAFGDALRRRREAEEDATD